MACSRKLLLISVLIAAAATAFAQPVSDGVRASPEDGGTRYWQVAGASRGLYLRATPSTGAPRISSYPAGTILNNLGCQSSDRRVWCDVQEVGGGPRGYVAAEYLVPAVAPHGAVLTGADESAFRAGQGDFDATGKIPCAQYAGQPMAQCDFGVARGGGGDATVVVSKLDGVKRTLFFQLGRAIGADTSQADGYGEFRAEVENDLTTIRVGAERYEIPYAVLFGG